MAKEHFWNGFEKRAAGFFGKTVNQMQGAIQSSLRRFKPKATMPTVMPSTAKPLKTISEGPTLNYAKMQTAEETSRKARLNPPQPAVLNYSNPRSPVYTKAVSTPGAGASPV